MSNLLEMSSRKEFGKLIDGLNLKIGVELGVAAGIFSDILLKNSNLEKLFSIDRWNDHHNEEEMKKAKTLLSVYKERSIILQTTFDKALNDFSDDYFDFIYIDGYAHTGQDNGKTLNDWYPKLKSGGIFAGHDYHPRWTPTIIAVDAFVEKHDLKLYLTKERRYPSLIVKELNLNPELARPRWPSWYIQKP